MEIEDEILLEDDINILNIIEHGWPRRRYDRTDYFHSMDNFSFFKRFRLTKPTVLSILEQIDEQLEFDNNLNNSISPLDQLLTTLRFYATDGHQLSLGDFMGSHQSTVCRIITRVSAAIANLRPQYIRMPNVEEVIQTHQEFFVKAQFPRVIGCIDGTHIKLQSPGGDDAEVFRNRKGFMSVNTQVICGPNMKILDIVARWPGSTHDSTIFGNSRICARFEAGEFRNSVLLGDGGYMLKSYLLTPLLNPQTRGEQLYNQSHIRTRNTVERLFGIWKRRFPVLAYGLRCKFDTSLMIIVATAVLQNIATAMNEDLPPPPQELGIDELQYLIDQGQIPHQNINERVNQNYRQQIIDNYFSNLE